MRVNCDRCGANVEEGYCAYAQGCPCDPRISPENRIPHAPVLSASAGSGKGAQAGAPIQGLVASEKTATGEQIGWLCFTDNGCRHFIWKADDADEQAGLDKRYPRREPVYTRIASAVAASSRTSGRTIAPLEDGDMHSTPATYEPASPSSSIAATEPVATWLRENAPDCGDNSCLFGGRGKGGMRTNGGCRCFKDLPTAKRIYVERLFSEKTATVWKRGEQRVVCAALKDESGRIVTGARHFDAVMMEQIRRGPNPDAWRAADQGFIDQRGAFLTREEARKIAEQQGQILEECGGNGIDLYSENLY